jgi:hypothetical protein
MKTSRASLSNNKRAELIAANVNFAETHPDQRRVRRWMKTSEGDCVF